MYDYVVCSTYLQKLTEVIQVNQLKVNIHMYK